jgi:chromosome segregation ATPase
METVTTTYQAVIESARTLARDTLRTRNIHKLVRDKAELDLSVTLRRDDAQKWFDEAKKALAIVNYKISKLDQADPELEDKQKTLTDLLENATKELNRAEDAQKAAQTYANEVELEKKKLDEKIDKWENGESKVQLENLNELAREYVEIFQSEKAKTLV